MPVTSLTNFRETLTEFVVDSGGALSDPDYKPVTLRSHVFNVASSTGESARNMIAGMEQCPPLAWHMQTLYQDARADIEGLCEDAADTMRKINEHMEEAEGDFDFLVDTGEAYRRRLAPVRERFLEVKARFMEQAKQLTEHPPALENLPADASDVEKGCVAWLRQLGEDEWQEQVVPVFERWFNGELDPHDADYIACVPTSVPMGPEDVAFRYFERMDGDKLDKLGIELAECPDPNSGYEAAILTIDIESANKAAAEAGIPVRFKKAR